MFYCYDKSRKLNSLNFSFLKGISRCLNNICICIICCIITDMINQENKTFLIFHFSKEFHVV